MWTSLVVTGYTALRKKCFKMMKFHTLRCIIMSRAFLLKQVKKSTPKTCKLINRIFTFQPPPRSNELVHSIESTSSLRTHKHIRIFPSDFFPPCLSKHAHLTPELLTSARSGNWAPIVVERWTSLRLTAPLVAIIGSAGFPANDVVTVLGWAVINSRSGAWLFAGDARKFRLLWWDFVGGCFCWHIH